MLILTKKEQVIANAINDLKSQSGSHSPSVFTLFEKIPSLQRKIDACFLSNPYATDLLVNYLNKDLIKTDKLREIIEFYPSQNQVIAEKLSSRLQIAPGKIFMGNGATEIIQAIIHNFVKQKILIILPTFSAYYEFVKPGVEVIYHYLERDQNFELDINRYLEFVKQERPDTVVLINPNNPTGNYIPFAKIKYMLDEMESVDNIIIDESFIHFTFEDENYHNFHSTEKLANRYKNLIIIKSMSKDFGIAGIRAGYAIMNETKVRDILKNGYLWNLSGLAEYFFNLYTNARFMQAYETARIKYIKNAQRCFLKLSKIKNIKVYPSKANFVLMELTDGSKGIDFAAKILIKHGIYTRICNDKKGLEGGEFIRIAARKKSENQIIINAIARYFF